VSYRFRPWQLALALIVICAAAVAAVMYFRRGAPLTPAQMVSYIPRGESTLLYLDVEALRDSGILEKLAGSTVTEEADYKKFVAQIGFDYRTDLDSVLSSTSDVQQLFLLKGRFDWKALIKYANTHGGTCVNGFCRVPSEQQDRFVSFYPIASNVMSLGVSKDAYAAGNIRPPQKSLPVEEVPTQPIWISIPASTLKNTSKLPAGTKLFASALAGAEKIVLTMGPEQQRYELAMDVTCKTASEAAVLRAQLEGITGLLKKLISRENQTPNPNDLSGILTAGVFERQDRHVVGKWPVQKSFIDTLGATTPGS
jgi:hypothetical protein